MVRTIALTMLALALLLSSCADPVTAARQSAPALAPAPTRVVVVATPTPGPDYNATRSAIDIQAAANRAAGDEAFRLAGEAELDAQRAIATIQAQQVAATASHAETRAAIQATQGAELHAIAGAGTRAAIEIEVSAAQGAATRQAMAAQTAEAERAIERKHEAALRVKERDAEQRAADWKALTRPLLALAPGILVLALCVTAACMLMRLALSRNVVDDFLEVIERMTGNFAPGYNVIEAEPLPMLADGSQTATAMTNSDQEMVHLLAHALKAQTYAYDQLRAAGWGHGAKTWTRLMEQLKVEGWAILISNNRGGEKYIEPQGRSIINALYAYGGVVHPPTPANGNGP